jgi:hypothetical protein
VPEHFGASPSNNLCDFAKLHTLNIDSLEADFTEPFFIWLSENKLLRKLSLNFPLKYENLHPFEVLFRHNNTIETLKIVKFKPSHFHFLRHLSGNTALRSLTFELYKVRESALSRLPPETFN